MEGDRKLNRRKKTIVGGIVEGMLDEDARGSCTCCHYAYTFPRKGGGLWIRNFLALEKATAVRKPPAEETDFQADSRLSRAAEKLSLGEPRRTTEIYVVLCRFTKIYRRIRFNLY